MHGMGSRDPLSLVPITPDTIGAAIGSSAGAVVTGDWPSNAQVVLFSAQVDIVVNFRTTGAALPSTNSNGTTSSSGLNEINPGVRQIPGGSTGYSVNFPSSGVASICFWRK